jgi:hypothetical protein
VTNTIASAAASNVSHFNFCLLPQVKYFSLRSVFFHR